MEPKSLQKYAICTNRVCIMCKPQKRSFLGGSRQPHFKARKTTHMRHYKYQHDLEKSLVIASTKKWVIPSSQVAMFLQKDVQIEASLGS